MGRIRRKWAADEHTLLENAVAKAQDDGRPLIWHEIAAHVPGRTNKDCRKRWYGKTAAKVKKGPWTSLEDSRLFNAVKQHGTKWSVVAREVESRTGDQCSKRWSYTLNPDIDRSAWTPMEDELLLDGVNEYGHNWQHIKSIYFPRRTSLGAKNRYHLLRRRFEGGRSYAISPLAQVSNTSSASVDESFRKDRSDLFQSQHETDENKFEENDPISTQMSPPQDEVSKSGLGQRTKAQHDSRALEAELSNNLSDGKPDLTALSWPFCKLADTDDSITNHTPFSNVDIIGYSDVAPSITKTKKPVGKPVAIAPTPSIPPSTFRENSNCATQDIDDFAINTLKYSPTARAICSWEDQARFNAETLFSNEPRMLGLDPQFASSHTSIESSTAAVQFSSDVAGTITPVATPTSHVAAQACLSPPAYQPLYSNNTGTHSSISIYPPAKDKFGGDLHTPTTRRITIEAVCLEQDVGTIVQAVNDLSLMAVFKSDD